MNRRALIALTLAVIYIAYIRARSSRATQAADRTADARWANEGGANASVSV